MPIYEYECTKCGHRFEVIQKVSARPIGKCEKCKGKTERLLSSPAIQFKGTGWYVTDYAKKSTGPDSSGSQSESGAKKKETKKTAKAASKSDD